MRLLFDHGVPAPLRRFLAHHQITLAKDMGWAEYVNGRLLAAAEDAGFEVMVTCDKRMIYEQNLSGRRIGIAVLPTNLWPDLEPHRATIVTFIDEIAPGNYRALSLPRRTLRRRQPPDLER